MPGGNNGGEYAFTVRDPTGLTVCLADSTWNGHITQSHSEMAAYRNEVIETLRQPDEIRREAGRPNRLVYVKECSGLGEKYAGKQVVVYVKVLPEGRFPVRLFRRVGYVCTAHFAAGARTAKGIVSGKWRRVYQARETAGQ